MSAHEALLTEGERRAFLSSHAGWTLEGEEVVRTFPFSDFGEAMGFVTRVGLAAQAADHHPDIDVRWNKVTLRLSTHSAGGLTGLDRDLAAEIDGFVA
jgi:4a-hydroxytetrahydrobiopterin dehydratase